RRGNPRTARAPPRGSARCRHAKPPWSTPDLPGDLDDHAELRPLLLLGQDIAFLGRGEAALRRQGELVERDVLGRLVDALPDRVLAFELAALGGDEADHHDLFALRQKAQRLEPAGALGVVFEEIAVDALDRAEQVLGDELVAARRDEGRAKIAAAGMHG